MGLSSTSTRSADKLRNFSSPLLRRSSAFCPFATSTIASCGIVSRFFDMINFLVIFIGKHDAKSLAMPRSLTLARRPKNHGRLADYPDPRHHQSELVFDLLDAGNVFGRDV